MHSRDLLTAAAGHAADFLETLPDGRVEAEVLDADELRARLALPLPDGPTDPGTVLDELVSQHEIKWVWVKGHAGHDGNERADQLANKGVASLI